MTTISGARTCLQAVAVAAAAALLMTFSASPAMAQDPAPADAEAAVDGLPPLSTDLDAAPAIDPLTGLPIAPADDVDPGFDLFADDLAEEPVEEFNPYSFQHMWEAGDVVSRTTLITLILMSAASWYIIATKVIDQTRLIKQARRLGQFWAAGSVTEGLNRLGSRNPYRLIANVADIDGQQRGGGLAGRIAVRRRAEIDLGRAIDHINNRLQSGMSVLATVGATAPFVGLLGTVWGIRNALIEIGLSGEPSIERVAGPVGEALLMTAIGLIVAVPAVFMFNVFGRRNKKAMQIVNGFAADVDALVVSAT